MPSNASPRASHSSYFIASMRPRSSTASGSSLAASVCRNSCTRERERKSARTLY